MQNLFPQSLLAGVALSAALLNAPAGAAEFTDTWFFGDSLSDTGTIGRFTTNPGAIWTEVLARRLGTTAAPAAAGGTDYAGGWARIYTTWNPQPTITAVPVAGQVTAYLAATGGRADASALYTVWGGANDIFYAGTALPAAAIPGYLYQTTAQEVGVIQALSAAGARHIIVPTMPDMGLTPAARLAGPAAAAGFTSMSVTYNQLLYGQLANAGLHVIAPDTFNLTREITANPAAYGIVNTASWACSTANSPATLTYGALLCNAGTLNAPGADQLFMFADGVHPTTITHQIFGDYVYSILAAPVAISMLAETAVRTRSGLDEVVVGEALLGGESGRYWVALEGGKLAYDSGADVPADGTPIGFTFGADRHTRLGRLGLAVNLAGMRPSLAGLGVYRQQHYSLSVYGSRAFGALQLGLAATLGHLSYDVRRDVALGPATRRVQGSTSGANVSLGLLAQYALQSGRLEHGPLLGVDLQHVDLSAFTESTAAGVSTSMSFGSQQRNACIGRIGYQLSLGSGTWAPYARASYEHDFAPKEREIEASLASVPGSGWSVPAVRVDTDAANLALGSRWQAADGVQAWLEIGGSLGRSEVTQYGARAGVRFGL
ncbi:MAG: autotransporter domain-containing protein [Gammaproteobacteria bacterium]|nr:autotransporter domain-containing protein [Gammaproteobacteria bacterium]